MLERTLMNVYTYIDSPLGKITLQANESGMSGVWFETHTTQPDALGKYSPDNSLLQQCEGQLTEYFSGKRSSFEIPISAQGTAFQKKVWHALTTIPYGETWSYQELANAIDNPKAVRAVGLANGKNPISIIVPCHRVIGKNGKLTGYAGSLERKAWLLDFENSEIEQH
jgi:methylated-DNA-[protein]-cysteine S-methyltransferase